MLFIFSSHPFYTKYVCLPSIDDPVLPKIYDNPKFWPYFKDIIGAINGSHIHSVSPLNEQSASQNCLFTCSFDLKFVFAYTGWEGSVTDAQVYEGALLNGLDILKGKYYLADAEFLSCEQLLIPY